MGSILGRVWFPLCLAVLLLLAVPVLLLVILHLAGADGAVNEWLQDSFRFSYEFRLHWALGVLFLLVPLLILLLYFLKLKRKPLQVPSTFLWRKSIEDLHVNTLFQWLRENVLLLLQLLAVLLLLYAVMGFRFHGSTAKKQHYILAIDNSASMSATDVKPTRLEWAKDEALKVIDAATEDSLGMVIAFNSKATTLQAYTASKAKLREAVREIRPTHRPTRIEDALTLADSLANQRRSTEDVASRPDEVEAGKERTYVPPKGIPTDLYLFSDGRFPIPPASAVNNLNSILVGNNSALGNLRPHFHLAGKRGAENVNNVGIVTFNAVRLAADRKAAGRDAFTLQVLVQARNYGPEARAVRVRLDVTADGQRVHRDEQILDLPPRKVLRGDPKEKIPDRDEPGEVSASFVLPPLDAGTSTVLHAYLDGHADDFPLDDQAWLVVGTVRKARVLIVGPDNALLDAFFKQKATEKIAKVDRLAPADLKGEKYRAAAQGGEYDLVIFDRCIPEREEDMPRSNSFCIDRPPPPWRRGGKGVKDAFLMVSKKDHALLRHITTLWDVDGVSGAFHFDLKDNLPEDAKGQFNLDGKQPGKRVLPPLTRLMESRGDVPVVFTLPRGGFTDLVLTFPLVSDKGELMTDWALKPSFPLFLRNVLLVLGNVGEGMRDGTVPPGEPMVLRPEAGVRELEVTPPGGRPETLRRGERPEFLYGGTDRVGLYAVKRDDGVVHHFAVNLLDAEESNIEPRPRFSVGKDVVSAGQEWSWPVDLWKWIVLAGLALLMVEWYVYNRRVYV